MMKNLAIFCGAKSGKNPAHQNAATVLGEGLAARSWGLVYGGGGVGLMGAVAQAVLRNGGRAIGVIPEFLRKQELAHEGLHELIIVKTLHERKARMEQLAHGFIALPGGFGTLDEFCEIVTWLQLSLHQKPCAVLNVDGFFDPFKDFIERAVAEGFVDSQMSSKIIWASKAEEILELMAPSMEKALP